MAKYVLTKEPAWPFYAEGGFLGVAMSSGDRIDNFCCGNVTGMATPAPTPTPTGTQLPTRTPQNSVLDDFNRANGAVGSNWSGNTSKFAVANQRLVVTTSNDWGYLIWKNAYFDANQEAYLTVRVVNPDDGYFDLFLKAQTNIPGYVDTIDVGYNPVSQTLEVHTYDGTNGWQAFGTPAAVNLRPGDRVGAVATDAGQVLVYHNEQLVSTVDVTGWPYYALGGYIGLAQSSGDRVDDFGGGTITPPTVDEFPQYAILDNFNRANGAIGSNWGGSAQYFAIQNQVLRMTAAQGANAIFWNTLMEVNQEAYFTITALDTDTNYVEILLKTQSLAGYQSGIMVVRYVPAEQVVYVRTYDATNGWVQRGVAQSVTFAVGDQFGATAEADGRVRIYRNGALINSVDAAAWPFYAEDGYIGIGLNDGNLVDDFGGGASSSGFSLLSSLSSFFSRASNWVADLFGAASDDAGVEERGDWSAIDPENPVVFEENSGDEQSWQENEAIQAALAAQADSAKEQQTDPFADKRSTRAALESESGAVKVEPVILPFDIQPALQPESADIPAADGPDTLTIDYTYDSLNRLTAAEYDSGLSFTYQYDAAGNRLSEVKVLDPLLPAVETAYTYDDANRIATVNNVPYTWDANGNLLNDGAYTYTYNSANQLTAVSASGLTTGYTYNGLGDRLSQFKNGVTAHYTLDLNAGLTQVLQDGTNTYLYGVNRIAQVAETQTGYFLPDALGSVRQMTDEYGDITLTRSYTPYGEILYSEGTANTDYAFTGESYDPQTGLAYLRARYYNPSNGRFTSRDTWAGDVNTPLSYNLWAYGYDNPVRYSDPSGFCPDDDGDGKCDFPSKQVSKTCSVLYGKDRLACEAIVYGVNPDKGLSIPEIHALVIKSECGNGNLGDYFSSPRAPQSFDRDARQYGIWFHWLANTIPGWWNNERTKDVQIQQLVAVAFGREATATYYTLPDEKYFFERAFAVKMWHPDYSFYMYMGGREVVLDAVTLTLFGQPCPAKEHPTGCPPTDPVNSSEFTNQMGDASQYGIGTIPFESAYDILHDPDLREYSPSAPWDFGNPTDATPQKVKDAIDIMDTGPLVNQLIHITNDRKAFFVTLPQQNYLCNNKSCV